MSTPLFLLRCTQLGLNLRDLELLTIGLVTDMFTERLLDDQDFPQVATQRDFDVF